MPNTAATLKERLLTWQGLSPKKILKEIETEISKKITESGFDNLIILNVMENDKRGLGDITQDCIINRLTPLPDIPVKK